MGHTVPLDSLKEAPPTSRGKFDFCEVQKTSRAVLTLKGGGGGEREGSDREGGESISQGKVRFRIVIYRKEEEGVFL